MVPDRSQGLRAEGGWKVMENPGQIQEACRHPQMARVRHEDTGSSAGKLGDVEPGTVSQHRNCFCEVGAKSHCPKDAIAVLHRGLTSNSADQMALTFP